MRLQEEALTVARQTGDQHGIASTLQSMGVMARDAGDPMRAQTLMGEGLNTMQQIGCLNCSAKSLADLAFLANASHDSDRLVQLLGAADALRERTGIVASTAVLARIDLALAEARQLLGEGSCARAWSVGRSLSLAEATALALAPTTTALGKVAPG